LWKLFLVLISEKLRSTANYLIIKNILNIMEMISIPKDEYERLKMQANIDVDLLKQLVRSVKDIKEDKVIRVK